MPIEKTDLVPHSQAARLIHQKTSTLATWRCTGKGPAFYKVGRRVFYSRADLDAWIASRRREPQRCEPAKAGAVT